MAAAPIPNVPAHLAVPNDYSQKELTKGMLKDNSKGAKFRSVVLWVKEGLPEDHELKPKSFRHIRRLVVREVVDNDFYRHWYRLTDVHTLLYRGLSNVVKYPIQFKLPGQAQIPTFYPVHKINFDDINPKVKAHWDRNNITLVNLGSVYVLERLRNTYDEEGVLDYLRALDKELIDKRMAPLIEEIQHETGHITEASKILVEHICGKVPSFNSADSFEENADIAVNLMEETQEKFEAFTKATNNVTWKFYKYVATELIPQIEDLVKEWEKAHKADPENVRASINDRYSFHSFVLTFIPSGNNNKNVTLYKKLNLYRGIYSERHGFIAVEEQARRELSKTHVDVSLVCKNYYKKFSAHTLERNRNNIEFFKAKIIREEGLEPQEHEAENEEESYNMELATEIKSSLTESIYTIYQQYGATPMTTTYIKRILPSLIKDLEPIRKTVQEENQDN